MLKQFGEEYRSKLTSAETAASLLRSNTSISMGMALAEPPALLKAIADRVEAHELSGLKLWYFHSMEHAGNTLLRYDLLDRVRPHCMFLSSVERELIKRGEADRRNVIDFVPVAFSESSYLLSELVDVDAFVTTVSPMDRHGWFTFGTSNDYGSTVARSARRLIVEVNPRMPRVFGDSLLHVSEVDAIVEHETPLIDCTSRERSWEDDEIARRIGALVNNGACLQMGIGALPNAVCAVLKDREDLGIHTELLTPGVASLIECGAVTNRKKETFPGRNVFTFAMGDAQLYALLDDNPSFSSIPVQIVNDPRHIAKNDNVVSINATLQIDLTGACNSENLLGKQFSGSGGQLDFVRGAQASRGGKSIIACHSTAKEGQISRIVPRLNGPVTTPRNDTQWVATEFGAINLKGKSSSERARALIALAHPKFQDELTKAAQEQGLL